MILEQILKVKRQQVDQRMRKISQSQLEDLALTLPPAKDFVSPLLEGNNVAVIAEHKRASPSKGIICSDKALAEVIKTYREAGAKAVSILTEEHFFLGQDEDLVEARKVTDLPILRKDFIIDSNQILEARALGADAVLLIAAALSAERLNEYIDLTVKLGMTPLVEVHSHDELALALSGKARVIGINSRNLQTFETDLEAAASLASVVPEELVLVAESGIKDEGDVRRIAAVGFDAVLVGETLMRAQEPGSLLRMLCACPRHRETRHRTAKVKMCGFTRSIDAVTAASEGVDYIGFVFAPSPRRISSARASEIREEVLAGYSRPGFVGVFVDSPVHEVSDIVQEVGLDMVQLHGSESVDYIRRLSAEMEHQCRTVKIFKSIVAKDRGALGTIAEYEPTVDGILLDSGPAHGFQGGTGISFDWSLALEVRCRFPKLQLALAGGLKDSNIRRAIKSVNPDIVDVCSGVESGDQRGKKDAAKIRAFMEQIRMIN